MSYEVLARKWRPQRFKDVVGQDHVARTLLNAIKSNRIAHAYLFVGPRGIGKTSIARIFAKALNCSSCSDGEPCCKCDSCKGIAAGTSMDVIEIDGASNNSVEQIRDLMESVKYAPSNTYKIYIIDEVHMLSNQAFNALLKTLEEPPPFVKFIFATTEPQKILATIISRCQRFDLRRISVNEIIDRLKLIAGSEKIKIDEDALLAIARGAEGGMRDAQSALDQLISFRGGKISEEDVLSVFGLVSRGMLEGIAESILDSDIRKLIACVSELDDAGKDMQRVLLELMEHFRNLVVCIHAGDQSGSLDFTETQFDVLKKQAAKTDTGRVLRICGILSQADDKMKFALSKRTILELALIRCARAASVVSLEEILDRINRIKDSVGTAPVISSGAAESSAAVEKPVKVKKKDEVIPVAPEESTTLKTDSQLLSKVQSEWPGIVEKVGKVAPLAPSFLMDAKPLSIDGDKLVIGFDPEFADEMTNFRSDRNRRALERVIRALTGKGLSVEMVVAGSRFGPDVYEDEQGDIDHNSGTDESFTDEVDDGPLMVRDTSQDQENKVAEKKKNTEAGRSVQDWISNPSVRQVLEVFDGTILDVRE